jgi:hypothetical protein
LNYGIRHTETGGHHLIVGIVLAEFVPGQDTFGERSNELGEHLRGQGLKRHNILLVKELSSSLKT